MAYALEHAVCQAKRQRAVAGVVRAETLDEVFVAVGRMKRHARERADDLVVADKGLEVRVSLGEERQDVVSLVGAESEERALIAEPHRLRRFEDGYRPPIHRT